MSKHTLTLCAVAAGLAICSSLAQAQTELLYYDFNQPLSEGSVVDQSGKGNNGTIHTPGKLGADQSGVTGDAGDYAFDNSGSRMGVNTANSAGSLQSPAIGTLSSFSIALWFKADSAFSGTARLFNAEGSAPLFLASNGSNMLTFRKSTNPNTILAQDDSLSLTANTWYFVTVTYDGTKETDNVKLWLGTKDGASTLLDTGSSSLGNIDLPSLYFGSTPNGSGGFDGWMDNIRIYGQTQGSGGVLTQAQIENLRVNNAIPEPSTTALGVALVAATLLVARRRRKQA